MRQIKFRAWDGEKMHYPEYSDKEDFHVSAQGDILFTKEYGYERHELTSLRPDTWKLMQCTPWYDKHKKPIYEDDILQLTNEDGQPVRVICQFGEHLRKMDTGHIVNIAGFAFVRISDGFPTFPIIHNYAGVSDLKIIEIIGNLHEHPTLLT